MCFRFQDRKRDRANFRSWLCDVLKAGGWQGQSQSFAPWGPKLLNWLEAEEATEVALEEVALDHSLDHSLDHPLTVGTGIVLSFNLVSAILFVMLQYSEDITEVDGPFKVATVSQRHVC